VGIARDVFRPGQESGVEKRLAALYPRGIVTIQPLYAAIAPYGQNEPRTKFAIDAVPYRAKSALSREFGHRWVNTRRLNRDERFDTMRELIKLNEITSAA